MKTKEIQFRVWDIKRKDFLIKIDIDNDTIVEIYGSELDKFDLKNVNLFELFDELMESYCEAVPQIKYEKTLKKIGEWVDEAREGYGIKK